jgi:hypothetical protein
MKNSIPLRIAILTMFICAAAVFANALEIKHDEYNITKEKELKVDIEIAFGSITIERGEKGLIAEVDYEEGNDKEDFDVSYEVTGETGRLSIKLKKATYTWGEDDDEDKNDHAHHKRHLHLKLNDAIPTSFNIELGAGKGDIDFTGLQVKDVKISTGASSVNIKCDKPNAITADEISIETGVSKFSAKDMGNLNFRKLKFSGGIGSYKLDFNGTLRQSAKAEIEVGLGSIHVYIPKTTPAKIEYDDTWLSSFDIDDDFETIKEDVYTTKDFEKADKKLTIKLEAGLGSVRVSRK